MPYKDNGTRNQAYAKKDNSKWLKQSRDKYATDPEYRQKLKTRSNNHRLKYLGVVDPLILEFKKNGCLLCGEKEPCCLSAHHVDPSLKEYEIAFMRKCLMKADKVIAELRKCVCVCHNCHSKIHAGLETLEAN